MKPERTASRSGAGLYSSAAGEAEVAPELGGEAQPCQSLPAASSRRRSIRACRR